MAIGDQPFLSKGSTHPGRNKEGPAERRPMSRATRRGEHEAGLYGRGTDDGAPHTGDRLHRVLGDDARRRAGRVRDSRQGGAAEAVSD